MSVPESDAWNAALYVVEKLRAGNHVALLAGGCVRDRLMAISPKDYDVATDATPKTVKKIFPWARRVGAKFGVMLVRRHGHDIEVATFRADGTYSDGRHPDEVRFGNQEEDAQRRDFTINGLFLDPTTNRIIDYVDGQKDITGRVPAHHRRCRPADSARIICGCCGRYALLPAWVSQLTRPPWRPSANMPTGSKL